MVEILMVIGTEIGIEIGTEIGTEIGIEMATVIETMIETVTKIVMTTIVVDGGRAGVGFLFGVGNTTRDIGCLFADAIVATEMTTVTRSLKSDHGSKRKGENNGANGNEFISVCSVISLEINSENGNCTFCEFCGESSLLKKQEMRTHQCDEFLSFG